MKEYLLIQSGDKGLINCLFTKSEVEDYLHEITTLDVPTIFLDVETVKDDAGYIHLDENQRVLLKIEFVNPVSKEVTTKWDIE